MDPEQTLYHRVGGTDAIAAFVDDLMQRLVTDLQLGVFWRGKCRDSMRRDRQLLIEFISAATGGPAFYAGRDMKTSHEGLGISESDWNIFARHVVAVLEDLGVAESDKAELLTLVAGLKGDIVEAHQVSSAGH